MTRAKTTTCKKLSGSLLREIAAESIPLGARGSVADYIPELARVRRGLFSISCATHKGEPLETGDTEHFFTMQSLSKIFTLALAIEKIGAGTVFRRVGMEPSADSFNSLMRLEMTSAKPSNPFINAGAIVISAMLNDKFGGEAFNEICGVIERMAGAYNGYDDGVYASENSTADRNRALAYFMKSMGFLRGDPEKSLQLYFKCCSIFCNTKALANAAMVLAQGGRGGGGQILKKETAYIILGLMSTCGLYNGSGEFAVRAGLAAKSGVSGGILAAAPGRMGIGVFSPALDGKGNSIAGIRAIELLSDVLDLRNLRGGRRAAARGLTVCGKNVH